MGRFRSASSWRLLLLCLLALLLNETDGSDDIDSLRRFDARRSRNLQEPSPNRRPSVVETPPMASSKKDSINNPSSSTATTVAVGDGMSSVSATPTNKGNTVKQDRPDSNPIQVSSSEGASHQNHQITDGGSSTGNPSSPSLPKPNLTASNSPNNRKPGSTPTEWEQGEGDERKDQESSMSQLDPTKSEGASRTPPADASILPAVNSTLETSLSPNNETAVEGDTESTSNNTTAMPEEETSVPETHANEKDSPTTDEQPTQDILKFTAPVKVEGVKAEEFTQSTADAFIAVIRRRVSLLLNAAIINISQRGTPEAPAVTVEILFVAREDHLREITDKLENNATFNQVSSDLKPVFPKIEYLNLPEAFSFQTVPGEDALDTKNNPEALSSSDDDVQEADKMEMDSSDGLPLWATIAMAGGGAFVALIGVVAVMMRRKGGDRDSSFMDHDPLHQARYYHPGNLTSYPARPPPRRAIQRQQSYSFSANNSVASATKLGYRFENSSALYQHYSGQRETPDYPVAAFRAAGGIKSEDNSKTHQTTLNPPAPPRLSTVASDYDDFYADLDVQRPRVYEF